MRFLIVSVVLLCRLLPAAADVSDYLVRVRTDVGAGSGCWLGNGDVLTCWHVVRDAASIEVFSGSLRLSASVAAAADVTRRSDGPVVLRVGGGGVKSDLRVASTVPPVGDPVVFHGLGSNGSRYREPATLVRGDVIELGERKNFVRVNLADAIRVAPGDSGGPVTNSLGELVGVVLGAKHSEGVAAASTHGSLVEVMAVTQRGESRDVVTLYTARRCRDCESAKADIRSGVFADLGVDWVVSDLSERPVAGIDYAPAFGFRGEVWRPRGYDRAQTREWLQSRLRGRRSRQSAADPGLLRDFLPPVESESSAVVDIDWTGVRLGVLVSKSAPGALGLLRGPVQRAVDVASGGVCLVEVFSEADDPERFAGVRDAIAIDHRFTVYPFAAIDKVADVGFAKGVILKRLESSFDSRVTGEQKDLLPDLIFKRVSAVQWRRVTEAMGAPAAYVPASANRSWAETVIAVVFGLVSAMKAVRAGRGVMDWQREKMIEQVAAAPAEAPDFFAEG